MGRIEFTRLLHMSNKNVLPTRRVRLASYDPDYGEHPDYDQRQRDVDRDFRENVRDEWLREQQEQILRDREDRERHKEGYYGA